MSCYRKLTIYLMRHGECNDGEILRGRTDSQLSEQGLAQMWDAWRRLCEVLPDEKLQLLSSPLRRCSLFADSLASEMPEFFASPLHTVDWLQEIDFGQWDGQTMATLAQQYPEQSAAYWHDPINHTPPAGETVAAFSQRVRDGWQALQQQLLQQDQSSALLISHGGVLRTLVSDILNPGQLPKAEMFTALDLPYGALLKITVYAEPQADGQWRCQSRLHWQLASA